ncbi:MAG: FTR1 family protein [Burkholderiales bacterium]|nr:FTR1 family protein [Burkholderiales bacterium]
MSGAALFTTTLIVFRESLEAALFIGIVAAATRGVAGRARWLGAGAGAGAVGAVILALLAERLSGWLGGLGQDAVNIGVLSLALAMLIWHCVWVSTHTQAMVGEARSLGRSVQEGRRTPWTLLVVVALAVLREGAETVLFVGGAMTGNGVAQSSAVLLYGAAGLGLGALLGMAIYAGLARIPTRHVFSVTNGLIALLAASLASQLVRALAQAGLIEAWTSPVWDTSRWLAPDSAPGTFLHALVGYDAQPSGAQLAAYLAVLVAIAAGTRLLKPKAASPQRAGRILPA